MPQYEGWTLAQVAAAIEPGTPSTLTGAGDTFTTTHEKLETLCGDIETAVHGLAGTSKWTGPAAAAFGGASATFVQFIGDAIAPLVAYGTELTNAADALGAAKTLLHTYQANVAVYRQRASASNTPVSEAAIDSGARQILIGLANEYRRVNGALAEIPMSPQDVRRIADEKPPGSKNKNTEQKDPSTDQKGTDEKGTDQKGTDGKGTDGKGTDETGTDSSGQQGGQDTPGAQSGATGDSGADPGGAGGQDSSNGGQPGGAGGAGPVPGTGGVPLTDARRNLPGAPTVTGRDGVTGIDVDGDGQPDLGLDGKPLAGATLITRDGVTGVDVNGDGVADIGTDGEILPGAAIVQGPDGTIGIDVNGDGIPDVGISGQVLPDAPIVTTDGVRGIDVDGDGIAELGMDRRPLPGATLITVNGVTGVDVNGDGLPDIGAQGEILPAAPMVTTPNGITGVDVNGDGKPDIAATGGLVVEPKRGAAAVPTPELPTVAVSNLAPANGTGLSSQLLRDQVVRRGLDDPPTTLARVQPVLGGVRSVPPMTTTPAVPVGFNPLPGSLFGGGFGPADDGAPPAQRQTVLVEADEIWTDRRGAHAVLGRPPHDAGESEAR